MTPEQYQQVGQLYHAALELAPDERAAFLDGASGGDQELRHEVETLLQAREQAGNYFAAPALDVAAELLANQKASALVGRTINHYQVLSLLGAGGMGEVYRARDTRLSREVAIKILPLEFSQDADRLRRFAQEARAASALNHPNIITVFDIGEVDCAPYLATEFVDGQTLRQRMTSALGLRAALDIAVQVANALAAAHEAKVIHRDIKPENVMVRRDGIVKVLDFGLAKLAEPTAPLAEIEAVTANKISTAPGLVMGTPQYMSPEQARGLEVDARSDLFSLGVMLYEMLAGHAPFTGATVMDVISAILHQEPLPLSQYLPEAPAELQRIVRKILGKQREERYQSTKELLHDLQEVQDELELQAKLGRRAAAELHKEGKVTTSGEPAAAWETVDETKAQTGEAATDTISSAAVILNKIKRHKRGVLLTLAILMVMGSGAAYWRYQRLAYRQPRVPFQTIKSTPLTHTGNAQWPALSPDGKYVAYVSREAAGLSIWLRHLDTGSAQQILPPVEVRNLGLLTFSRDGNHLYFLKSEKFGPLDALYRMPVLGGVATKLLTDLGGYALSPDGAQLAFVRNSRSLEKSALMLANADGTGEHKIATRKLSDPYRYLSWSPDGKVIACSAGSTEVSGARMYPVEVRVADGAERELTAKRWVLLGEVGWLADGSGLIVCGIEGTATSSLWQISYPGGEVRRLTDDASTYGTFKLAADAQILVATKTMLHANIWTLPVGDGVSSPAALARQITTGASNHLVYNWMSDSRILFTSSASNPAGLDIWVINADGTGSRQLTTAGANEAPAVSPDGRYIVFASDRAGKLNLWRMESDGSSLKQLTTGSNERFPACSPDGKWVVYTSADEGTLWKMPIDSGEAQQLTGKGWRGATISRDGKWIASFYEGSPQPDARSKIGVIPFAGGPPAKLIDFPTDIRPNGALRWTPDGQALTYPGKRDGIWNLWRQPLKGGQPIQLTDFKSIDQIFSFAWSPDSKQIVFSRGDWVFDVVLIRDVSAK